MIGLSPSDSPASGDDESTWSNPAKLSRKLRELALRSHQALKAEAGPHYPSLPRPAERQQDLNDLLGELARLRQKIHALGLQALVPWIDTLLRQVENRLNMTHREARP